MDLRATFPYMVYVNLGHREDRRRKVEKRFTELGLEVDRQPGVLKERVKDCWGFQNESRYACSLAKRLAIRRAKKAKAAAVMLFEDDVVLADDLHERLAGIELPEDWGIFFLGCKHIDRPVPIAANLLRVTRATDNHAIGIKAEYYDLMMRALSGTGKGKPKTILYSDANASYIQRIVPSYAVFPNLAWQGFSHSDNEGIPVTYYDSTGRQQARESAIKGLEEEVAAMFPDAFPIVRRIEKRAEPLVVEESRKQFVLLDLPVRESLEQIFPIRVYLNEGKDEVRRIEIEGQFADQQISIQRIAVLGETDDRRVRAICGAIRLGMASKASAILVSGDGVKLDSSFRKFIEIAELPKDWGVLFFESQGGGELLEQPVWRKCQMTVDVSIFALRAPFYSEVLQAFERKEDDDIQQIFQKLCDKIPCDELHPGVAIKEQDNCMQLSAWVREFFDARAFGLKLQQLPSPDRKQEFVDQFGIDVFAWVAENLGR